MLTKYYSDDQIRKKNIGWAFGTYGRREVHKGFWWGDLREGDNLEDLGINGRIILQWIFKKWEREIWTGLIWLRIGTGGGRL